MLFNRVLPTPFPVPQNGGCLAYFLISRLRVYLNEEWVSCRNHDKFDLMVLLVYIFILGIFLMLCVKKCEGSNKAFAVEPQRWIAEMEHKICEIKCMCCLELCMCQYRCIPASSGGLQKGRYCRICRCRPPLYHPALNNNFSRQGFWARTRSFGQRSDGTAWLHTTVNEGQLLHGTKRKASKSC